MALADNWQNTRLRIEQLELDPQNPRLPPAMQAGAYSQEEIALYIDRHYNPLQVAESIARHGFFESEPFIVTRSHDEVFTVLEGNRRLTALLGLASEARRQKYAAQNSGWRRLPPVDLPTDYPVTVVKDPSDVIPLLGFRHISGITPWDPFQQAGYIARLVEDGIPLGQVDELVGRPSTEVRSMYRDFDILRQARDDFGLLTTGAEENFGVFTAAMSRQAIRNYIGAPAPREVDPERWPLPEDRKAELEQVLSWVFGTPEIPPVIRESRQLAQLASVLGAASDLGRKELESSRDLDQAVDAISGPAIRGFADATAARRSLLRLLDATSPLPAETIEILINMRATLDELLGSRAGGAAD